MRNKEIQECEILPLSYENIDDMFDNMTVLTTYEFILEGEKMVRVVGSVMCSHTVHTFFGSHQRMTEIVMPPRYVTKEVFDELYGDQQEVVQNDVLLSNISKRLDELFGDGK